MHIEMKSLVQERCVPLRNRAPRSLHWKKILHESYVRWGNEYQAVGWFIKHCELNLPLFWSLDKQLLL